MILLPPTKLLAIVKSNCQILVTSKIQRINHIIGSGVVIKGVGKEEWDSFLGINKLGRTLLISTLCTRRYKG